MRRFNTASLALSGLLVSAGLSGFAPGAEPGDFVSIRDQIVAAYQASLDALSRGDAEAALQVDTDDWISVMVGQPTRTKQEMAVYIRRDIADMKPPPGWKAVWRPDYEQNGTTTGIQLYDLKVEGKAATVLCLVGGTIRVSSGVFADARLPGTGDLSAKQIAARYNLADQVQITLKSKFFVTHNTNM